MDSKILCKWASALACGWVVLLPHAARAGVSESDYLGDVPNVISVSRLVQTVGDTPGAVTVLDRDFIRMTGARSVVDVLRFVPGFQTTNSFETDAPIATYHGRMDDWAHRIQVLVDGRSVYVGLLQGSAGLGWQSLALDDIERIEVLRGSNSATYGARAFLGVVNIISRDVRETTGTAVSTARGENGVTDVGVSHSWNALDASFRLSADSVSDEGLKGAYGRNHTERLNFSSHFALEQGAELDVRAGGVGIYAGRGSTDPLQFGNPARNWFNGTAFIQADWRRTLDDAQDISVGVSHTQNTNLDAYRYPNPSHPYYGALVSVSGYEEVDVITAQHTQRWGPHLRTVWGGEMRRETISAPTLFEDLGTIPSDFLRLFASAEWRLRSDVLLNAGALIEHSDMAGNSVSPRIMLNWQLAPGHTLRAGSSTAFRPPSAFEKYARVRFFDANGQNPTGYFTFNAGQVAAERLFSQELGYNFAATAAPISGDVRIFQEHVTGGIAHTEINVEGGKNPGTYVNSNDDQVKGVEWQLNWAVAPQTRLLLTQTWTTIESSNTVGGSNQFRTEHGAPRFANSLALSHRFGGGWEFSFLHNQADDVALGSSSSDRVLSSTRRSDARLAREFRLAGQRAEWALVVQNLDTPTQDGDRFFYFERRAFMSLKFGY